MRLFSSKYAKSMIPKELLRLNMIRKINKEVICRTVSSKRSRLKKVLLRPPPEKNYLINLLFQHKVPFFQMILSFISVLMGTFTILSGRSLGNFSALPTKRENKTENCSVYNRQSRLINGLFIYRFN